MNAYTSSLMWYLCEYYERCQATVAGHSVSQMSEEQSPPGYLQISDKPLVHKE